jgi:hypothetical protein
LKIIFFIALLTHGSLTDQTFSEGSLKNWIPAFMGITRQKIPANGGDLFFNASPTAGICELSYLRRRNKF